MPLYSYLNLGPLFSVLDDITDRLHDSEINSNIQRPFIRMLYLLPILKGIFYVDRNRKIHLHDNAVKNFVYDLLNPVRLIDDTLEFLHSGLNRLLEIGAERFSPSSLPRTIAKRVTQLFLGIIKLPVRLVKNTIDLLLDVAKAIFFDPIAHVVSSTREAFNENAVLLATTKELQQAKELRRTAKGRDNTSYLQMTKKDKYSQEYIGTSKAELYLAEIEPDKIVAISASKQKIAKTASLISIVSFFKDNYLKEQAVAEAKTVISPH